MRRRVSLYIGDRLVDLGDQTLVLFNYTQDELSNPTIVKNSYSQQITLQGTPNNNRIFGDMFRLDRQVYLGATQTGASFNPSQKVPFTAYNELGEVLESGYVKLDSVAVKRVPEYKVTLYGGLGSFFYSLAYDDAGNKKSLASLQYLGNSPTELDFVINAATVRAAWDTVQDGAVDDKWKVLNFMPAYEGVPDGNFSPDKALVVPSDVGLLDTVPDGGVNYTVKDGYAVVNLAQPQDEWAVKDLRSYLQRPCISMRAIWAAVAQAANNGGYTVDKSAVDASEYADLWMTLPLIPSLGSMKQASGSLSLVASSVGVTGNVIARYDVSGSVAAGTTVTANIGFRLRYTLPSGTDTSLVLDLYAQKQDGDTSYEKWQVIFVQVLAYASDDTLVGGSKVMVQGQFGLNTAADMADLCNYTPGWSTDDYEYINQSRCVHATGDVWEIDEDVTIPVTAVNAAYYKIVESVYEIDAWLMGGEHPSSGYTITGDGSSPLPDLYENYDTAYTALGAAIEEVANSVNYESAESLRSGATVTKAMLLSSSATPADYIISFCKIFGFYFLYDGPNKKVTVVSRNSLYGGATIDLTGRVDLTKGITIKPLAFDSKWYDFKCQGVGGAFSDEYEQAMGIPYGIQRVNTGYDFNADAKDLLQGNAFKNAVTVLDKGKYWNYILVSSQFTPSPFVDKGNTYTLWNTAGKTLTVNISCPPSAALVTYYNGAGFNGYDINGARKLQLHNADRKPVNGENILVMRGEDVTYPYFKLSDDVPAMDSLNDGVPCWLLAPGAAAGISVPVYSRYLFSGDAVDLSLDFGVPKELDIPAITYPEAATVYARRWKAYMADKYNVNTKVMKCRVDFRGIQVNRDLLRRFFYYEGCLWALNKVKNYSLTTWDPVECEFIQVQDVENYTYGQTSND